MSQNISAVGLYVHKKCCLQNPFFTCRFESKNCSLQQQPFGLNPDLYPSPLGTKVLLGHHVATFREVKASAAFQLHIRSSTAQGHAEPSALHKSCKTIRGTLRELHHHHKQVRLIDDSSKHKVDWPASCRYFVPVDTRTMNKLTSNECRNWPMEETCPAFKRCSPASYIDSCE